MRRHGLLVLLALVAAVVLSMPLWLEPAGRGPRLDVKAPEGLAGFAALLRHWGASVSALAPEAVREAMEPEVSPGSQLETRRASSRRAWTEALEQLDDDVSMVLAFPATAGVADQLSVLRTELRAGHTVLALYSGLPLAFEESQMLEDLGVGVRDLGRRGRLAPWSWWQDRRQGYAHRLEQADAAGSEPAWSDPVRTLIDPAADCTQIAAFVGPRSRDLRPEGRALSVARCRIGSGELLLAPTSMLANARIGGTGNLRVARELAALLGDEVRFLEQPEQLGAAPMDARAGAARRALNLVGVQLVLLYLVGLLALARGFGPRWPSLDQPADAQRRFLLSVGALHRRLGDFGLAARNLQARWLEFDPLSRRRGEEELGAKAEVTEEELLRLATRWSRPRHTTTRGTETNRP